MSCQENWTMDKLLKKVYALHKQSLNDTTAGLMKCKDALQRSEEKVKDLETQNDHLIIENRRLSAIEDTKQTSSGSCCEVIRQSLQLVITSYKELLVNKDQRIKELENQLAKYKRRFTAGDSLNWTITEDTVNNRKSRFGLDHSPDSTSRSTPVGKTDPNITQNIDSPTHSAAVITANIDDKGGMRSPEDSNSKKRLQRRTKRSRYSEEVSPETKRPRLKAVTSSKVKDNVNHNRRVIVEDTCHSDSVRKPEHNSVGFSSKRQTRLEETVLIVPETLAVDGEHSDIDLDDEDIRLTQYSCNKLSRIEEISEPFKHDVTLDSHKSDSKKENKFNDVNDGGKVDKQIPDGSSEDYVEVGRSSCKSSGDALKRDRQSLSDRSRLKSILTSPETDGHNSENDSLYEAISDIGANIVDDFEEEEESLQSQQKGRKLSQLLGQHSSSSHPLGGRCRNMDEVNELFETPASKGNQTTRRLDDESTGNKKRLFKNSTKNRLSQEDVILRQSPRKRKDLVESKVIHAAESSTRRSLGHTTKGSSSGESDENDLTIAPETHESLTSTGNQSMDLYHIVPVKNGQPVTSKQFDVKIRKNKYGAKSVNDARSGKKNIVVRSEDHCEELDKNMLKPKIAEVITISSPSVGSLSDPESPLLLKEKKNTKSKDNKVGRCDVVDQNDYQIDRNKTKRSSSSSNLTNTKRNVTSKQHVEDQDLKMDSPRSKSFRQTTLTQKFFSPNGKQAKNSKCIENVKKSRKGLRMETDINSDDKAIVIISEDSMFKKPENPTCRQALSLRKKGKEKEQLHENQHHPLHDISSKHLNGSSTNLNGSLDPAAELTVLCRESDTEENQPIKSLPSLDTDFCGEDLVTGSESLPKTSTLATDDCEDIPSSYRFMPKKKTKEMANKESIELIFDHHVSLDDSFDRPPKKQEDNIIPHIAVVRKKDERQKLQGYGCKQCEEYYKSAGRNEDEVKHHMNQCSRHRAQFLPPDTPPHFWSVGFIDTQECVDRGYIKVDEKQEKGKDEGPTHRRRRKLNKYFRSKTEGTLDNDSDEELVYE